jgi:hypothetical protein
MTRSVIGVVALAVIAAWLLFSTVYTISDNWVVAAVITMMIEQVGITIAAVIAHRRTHRV